MYRRPAVTHAPTPDLAAPPADERRRSFRCAWTAVIVFVFLAAWGAIASRGFLEADGCTHYLYARHALEQKFYLLDVWGRPFKTIIYSVPAYWFGLPGVRFLSIVLACVTAWFTFLIAQGQGYRRPELAIILLLGQPLFFLHGFSELTELPFALLMAGGLLTYQRRAFAEMALLVGLMPLTRPEGFVMLLPAAVALVLHRRAYFLPIVLIPLVAWNHAGWVMWGEKTAWWRWLPDNWPYAGDSVYSAGSVFKFLALLPVLTSPVALPFMWIGMARSLRPWRPMAGRFAVLLTDHRARCQFLIALFPLGLLIGHSILHALGKMASNGELRYLLCMAPLWALCAAAGWNWAFDRFRLPARVLLVSIAVLLPIGLNVAYPIVPLKFDTNWQDAEVVANDLRPALAANTQTHIMVSHPGIFYFLDISINDPARTLDWNRSDILKRPPHTVLVWDDVYGVYNADRAKSVTFEEITAAGWIEKPITGLAEPQRWKMFVSEAP